MHFRVYVQFENITAGVRFCGELISPNLTIHSVPSQYRRDQITFVRLNLGSYLTNARSIQTFTRK